MTLLKWLLIVAFLVIFLNELRLKAKESGIDVVIVDKEERKDREFF